MRIGVIADTHGLLRPETVRAFRDCARILHAGDVGKQAVLEGLQAIAPVTAIRGNVDRGGWAGELPETETLTLDGVTIHMLHDRHELSALPAVAGKCVVISGHSHQPRIEEEGGVLWINPGSAGPRRFRLPVTVAVLEIEAGEAHARLIQLPV